MNFFQQVYAVAKKIPYGRVTTYGAIAEYLGSKKSSRMVGWALNATKYDMQNIPAHRVVNRKGALTGKNHFNDISLMEILLKNEGIEVRNNVIVNFQKVFWNPIELNKEF